MTSFDETMTAMALLDDAAMERSWLWRHEGEDLGVRNGYHRVLEAELAQLSRVEAAGAWAEPVAAMASAQQALGSVLGLLAGQPDDLLDWTPGTGDWPLRRVLGHMLEVELSFCANVRWAVSRSDEQPLAIPPELRPSERDAPTDGGIAALLGRLREARAATDNFVSGLAQQDLTKPSMWAGHDVDVRFRLHRFGSHLVEHGIHAGKILRAAGRAPGEAREMVRATWATRGAHERRSDATDLALLDADHAAMFAEMTAG